MKHNFDNIIDRHGTYSIKYDYLSRGKPEGTLPMWVADMDLPTPPCVIESLAECVHHGIYGYSEPDAAYFEVVQNWFLQRFGWNVKREWLVATPGVVTAIYIAVRALTEKGDGVLIQQPVYHPFEFAVQDTERKLLVNQLIYKNGQYTIDFDDFESKVKQAKLFILCSPHNPVGRVWTKKELTRMGEICLKHGTIIIADEIWQDLIYAPHQHQVFTALAPEFADITITATAPSKTFNLAGLQLSNIFIPNASLKRKFTKEYNACGLSQVSMMGLVSCKAAYEHGADWVDKLVEYLNGNMMLIQTFLEKNIPEIKLVKPEGTYLAWLDCSGLGITTQELNEIIINKAKLWLHCGIRFGKGGEGFQRINAACPQETLNQALARLKSAFEN